jgi:hemin uptake protein HemP
MGKQSDDGERSGGARPGAGAPRMISSREILGDDKLVIIHHEDEVYRLQRTAAGKLILTK